MNHEEKYRKEAAALTLMPDLEGTRKVAWKSPSNIALIKYWGKKPVQIPANASISFSLRNSLTETEIEYKVSSEGMQIEFYFEGEPEKAFQSRLVKYLRSLVPYMPFLDDLDMVIHSSNSFPHSSGIASSASAMSALALCLCSMEQDLFSSLTDTGEFYTKASFLARLGSGSAARSLYPGYSVWGRHPDLPEASDEVAVGLESGIHEKFREIGDTILITSPGRKKVSSSRGHLLMENHPYAGARIDQVNENFSILLDALKTGNEEQWVRVIEHEALSLHGLMLSSDPGFALLNDRTLAIIDEVRNFRQSEGIPVCFTLDAGPNVHLLHPYRYRNEIMELMESRLAVYCDNGRYIDDRMGEGPVRISNTHKNLKP